MTVSFHCTDITGHIRIGDFCFQWRNSFLLGSIYHNFGESLIIIGNRSFHFGQFRFI